LKKIYINDKVDLLNLALHYDLKKLFNRNGGYNNDLLGDLDFSSFFHKPGNYQLDWVLFILRRFIFVFSRHSLANWIFYSVYSLKTGVGFSTGKRSF